MGQLRILDKTDVFVGPGFPNPLLPERRGRRTVVVLTQPAATPTAMKVAEEIRVDGTFCEVVGLPDREEAKTLAVADSVYHAMAALGLTVEDTVVGVGGGSVTDVAGFVAGTWMRGIEVVHVPTTYLGAIDASIGGKTGLNVGGKNLVGIFWHPTRVVVDTDILKRLPLSLVREGMAEAYKSGLVGDATLADLIDGQGLGAPTDEIISRALSVKALLVEQDPSDRGLRAVLNFGHTIGHAIEFASTLSHGESVSLGMVAAARLSEKREGFRFADRIEATLSGLGLPVSIGGVDRNRLLDLVRMDKKRDAEGVRMVLLKAVGEPVVTHVDAADIGYALDSIGL